MTLSEHKGKLTIGSIAATIAAIVGTYNLLPQSMHVVFWSDLNGISEQQEQIIDNQNYFKWKLARDELNDLRREKAEIIAHMEEHDHPEVRALDKKRLEELEEEIKILEKDVERYRRKVKEEDR